MNMLNRLSCRFEQCLCTFNILVFEAISEKGIFRHLTYYIFGVRNCENTKSTRVILLLKNFKISSRFHKCCKKFREIFLFLR